VFQRGVPPEATFLFKHALVLDTAYGMLLRGPRQALHARIARVLEEQFPRLADAQPEILAHHCTEAALLEKAVGYWSRAGRQSEARAALVEATAHLRRGLRLAADLPSTRERARHELELQIALAGALRSTKGFWHPEVAEAFEQARSLLSESGEAGTISHFSVLFGLFGTKFAGGQVRAGLEHAREFLSLGQSRADSGLMVTGYQILGQTLITIGDYRAAFSEVERGARLYEAEKHRMLAFQIASDPGVTMRGFWALELWHQGYPDQANEVAGEVLRHARRPDAHPYHSLGLGLLLIGMTAIAARRISEAQELGSEAVTVGGEHGLPAMSGFGLILQGWSLAQLGQDEGAVESIRKGIEVVGYLSYRPIFLGLLAEALALSGKIEGGLAVLADALALAESSGARGNDAELHRLRGDLLGRLPSPGWTEIELCYRTALDIAREQGTRGFELRAAVSLARLLSHRGRRNEARDLLALVYGWFSEGFDTQDLKEAKALLEMLDG
jgi:predicted ATPase